MYYVNVFVSHSWTYSEHYDKLASWIFEQEWLSKGTSINFVDTSVPRDDPIHNARNQKELQERIFERIAASDVVVCPTGMYSSHSKWIDKELAGANAYRRPILAVNPRAQQKKSSVVQARADYVVGWNKQSVVDGIWMLANR